MKTNVVRFIFLFVGVFLISLIFIFPKNYNKLEKLCPENFEVYFSSNFEDESFETKQNGIGTKVACSFSSFLEISKKHNYSGITFETKSGSDEILQNLNAKIISLQTLENKRIIYAYSPNFDKHIMLNNQKCNIEIVFENNKNLVGIPLLLGSY